MMSDEFDDQNLPPGSRPEEPGGGEHTVENKPAPKNSSRNKPNALEPDMDESSGEPAKTDQANAEDFPGLTEQIRRFVEAELPSCPYCGSENTASVQVGLTGHAPAIAEATTKVKLVPNAKDKLGEYFCNVCGKYFN